MSNVYKNAIINLTTTANTTVYTCNATARAIIQNIQLTNQSGAHTVQAYVYSNSNTATVEISHGSMSSNETINMAKGPVVLQENDALLIKCDTTAITGIVSIMEVNRGTLSN